MPLATYLLVLLIVIPMLVLVVDIIRMVRRRATVIEPAEPRPTGPAGAPPPSAALAPVQAPPERVESSTAIHG